LETGDHDEPNESPAGLIVIDCGDDDAIIIGTRGRASSPAADASPTRLSHRSPIATSPIARASWPWSAGEMGTSVPAHATSGSGDGVTPRSPLPTDRPDPGRRSNDRQRGKDRTVPTCHSASRGRALTLCVVKSFTQSGAMGGEPGVEFGRAPLLWPIAEEDRPPVQPGVTLTGREA